MSVEKKGDGQTLKTGQTAKIIVNNAPMCGGIVQYIRESDEGESDPLEEKELALE